MISYCIFIFKIIYTLLELIIFILSYISNNYLYIILLRLSNYNIINSNNIIPHNRGFVNNYFFILGILLNCGQNITHQPFAIRIPFLYNLQFFSLYFRQSEHILSKINSFSGLAITILISTYKTF